jgi:WD repeat-containing protein 35
MSIQIPHLILLCRVEKLLQAGGGDDSQLTTAWNRIGDYYADRQKWAKAAQYYAQAKNSEQLVECFYVLENWAGLEKLIGTLPEGSSLLGVIGERFASVGICEHAVSRRALCFENVL